MEAENNYGQRPLHLAAQYGSAGTLDLIISNAMILLEWENNNGNTAAEIAAKYGEPAVLRKLVKYGGDPRRALGGYYRAWILALALQLESRQINTQTGRIGDDDIKYASIAPHPDYIWWYDTYQPRLKSDGIGQKGEHPNIKKY